MNSIIQTVNYDRVSDVLYLGIRPGRQAVSKEGLPGVLWRYDVKDGQVVGVTILDFGYYWGSRISELASDISTHIGMPPAQAKHMLEGVE